MTGTVLVMSGPTDHTCDLIVSALTERGTPVVRMDPGSGLVRMDVTLTPDGRRWRGLVGDEHRAVALDDVVSLLWRWPKPPTGNPAIADLDRRAWAAREDASGFYGVLKSLPVRWVNHPDVVAAADSKPGQLVTAAASGLTIPDSLVTTSGDAARRWARGRDVLFKAFHSAGADMEHMVVATRADVAALPAELGATSMFQEVIEGDPVRLTMVGPHPFAVVITGGEALDWRPSSHRLTFAPARVPLAVLTAVRTLMRRYWLEYGALDFIVTDDGAWVFLEINPTGMYGFVEIATGLPITAAIADRLCEPVRSPGRAVRPMAG